MQRAAASAPSPNPHANASTQPPAPHVDSRPSKRRKFDSYATSSTERQSFDLDLIQTALSEEEAKRESAIERLPEEAGETKWVLSTVNGNNREADGGGTHAILNVVNTAYGEIGCRSFAVI